MQNTKPFRWLHLTDFHFGLAGQKFLWPNLREAFFQDLEELHKIAGPWHAVFFTGDFVQRGSTDEFKEMDKEVLGVLFAKLKELGSDDVKLYCVPGNHDLERPKTDEGRAAVDTLLAPSGFDRCRTAFWKNSTNEYRKVIQECFASYHSWSQSSAYVTRADKYGELPGDYSCTHKHGDFKIGIVGLNTTFLQLAAGNYKERLEWNVQQLAQSCDKPIDVWLKKHHVSILLTHQGPDWLTAEARRHGATEIAPAGRFALHMFGHMHEPRFSRSSNGGTPYFNNELLGRSAFGLEFIGDEQEVKRSHGYSSGELMFCPSGEITFRLWPRIAACQTGPWRYVSDELNFHLSSDRATIPFIVGRTAIEPAVAKPTEGMHLVSFSQMSNQLQPQIEAALFTIYRPEYEAWYYVREPDSDIEKLPFEKPIWIWGASGTGKTALAHHFASKKFEKLIFVDLSSSVGLDLKATLANFYWTLVDALDSSEKYKSLDGVETPVDFLRVIERVILENCNTGTVILIDEFSCKEDESVIEFAKLISNLLMKLTNAQSKPSFQVIVGSVNSPLKCCASFSSKFLERVSVIHLKKWNDSEMEGWLNLASSVLSWLIDPVIRAELKTAAEGCPRMLKRICSLHLRHMNKPDWSLAQTLKYHEDELRF